MNLHRLASQSLLLTAVAFMAIFCLMTNGNPHQESLLAGTSIGLIAISIVAERLAPFRAEWRPDREDTKSDIAMFALVFGLIDGALKWLTPFAIIAVGSVYQPASTLPFWLEVPVVILAIEFMAWLSHWMHHHFKTLWSLHALHHAPEKLHTLNNFRFHPLNHVTNHLFMLAPVLSLGFSSEAVLLYTVASLPIVIFQHSNIDFDFGRLDAVFSTNVVHRYHHSRALEEGMCNLGRATVVWDRVFGTYHRPGAQRSPKRLGLFDGSLRHYPPANSVFRQIAWPFSRDCCA